MTIFCLFSFYNFLLYKKKAEILIFCKYSNNRNMFKDEFIDSRPPIMGSGHKFEWTKVRINKDFLLLR